MSEGPKRPDTFAKLVRDTQALKGVRQARPKAARSALSKSLAEPSFVFPDSEVRLLARAADCDPKRLELLRKGRIRASDTTDLHGLRKQAAREQLTAALRAAWDAGDDCILVIHGRGRSADFEPVLKKELPNWLTSPPLAAHVHAFAPAKPQHGGAGATYVLLREGG